MYDIASRLCSGVCWLWLKEAYLVVCTQVFIGIFPSSKTVITGAVNWAEVDDAYDFASRLLLQNFEEVCIPTRSKIFTQNTKMEGLTHELAASRTSSVAN